jgi:polysaccharide export outer membrane protein
MKKGLFEMISPPARPVAGFAAACMLLVGCMSAAQPQAQSQPQQPPQGQTLETLPAAPVPADYVIGPGDTLNVFVWQNPDLSVSVPVRPDGKITTPLIQDMVAVGKTPSQLAGDIETVLAEYIRSPKVNVILTHPESALNQVRVIGQVEHPSGVPYRDGMTVLDAVLAVGGLTPFASGNRAKLIREVGGRKGTIRLDLHDLVNKGDLRENVAVKPGDLIIVPESLF